MKLTNRQTQLARLYEYFASDPHISLHAAGRTEVGLRQYWDQESRGWKPAAPDPYYLRLRDGKAGFDLRRTELIRSFPIPFQWHGWRADWDACRGGERWTLPFLYDWLPTPLPDWATDEDLAEPPDSPDSPESGRLIRTAPRVERVPADPSGPFFESVRELVAGSRPPGEIP